MKKNIGSVDRILRIVLGLGVLGAGYYFKSWLGLIGLVPLLTAVVSFCPLYPLVGISTCKRPDDKG
jgi:hypothetical protein